MSRSAALERPRKDEQQQPVDQQLQNKLVAKFGARLMKDGFTAVPVLVQRYYRQVPGNALHDREGQPVCEISHMTPTEYAIMVDIWSWWWQADITPWPSVPQIAAHVGKSVRQVQRYISRMQDKGFLICLTQYNSEGKQLSNRYDFTPFLERLVALLEGLGELEKPSQDISEGDNSDRETVTPPSGGRVTFLTPKTDEFESDPYETNDSTIRGGSAATQKGRVLGESESCSHIAQGAIRNEATIGTVGTDETRAGRNRTSNPPSAEKETGRAERAKDVKEDKTVERRRESSGEAAARAAGIPLEHWRVLNGSTPQRKEGDQSLKLPSRIEERLAEYETLFSDRKPKSTYTQMARLYHSLHERGLDDYIFLDILHYARVKTQMADVTKTRMGYFCSVVRDRVALKHNELDEEEQQLAALGGQGEQETSREAYQPDDAPAGLQSEEPLPGSDASANVPSRGNSRPTETEQCAQPAPRAIVSNDPALGWKSYEAALWWAERLRDHLSCTQYRYEVLPTEHGQWGFVFTERGNTTDEWIFLTSQEGKPYLEKGSSIRV